MHSMHELDTRYGHELRSDIGELGVEMYRISMLSRVSISQNLSIINEKLTTKVIGRSHRSSGVPECEKIHPSHRVLVLSQVYRADVHGGYLEVEPGLLRSRRHTGLSTVLASQVAVEGNEAS